MVKRKNSKNILCSKGRSSQIQTFKYLTILKHCMKNTFSVFLVWFSVNVNLWLKYILQTESAHIVSVQFNTSSQSDHTCVTIIQISRNRTRSAPRSPSHALSQSRPQE